MNDGTVKEQLKKYQHDHRAEIKERRMLFYRHNSVKMRAIAKKYYISHRLERLDYAKKYNCKHQLLKGRYKKERYALSKSYSSRIREELLRILGIFCRDCGYDNNWRALQLDHIDNDGYVDRKLHGNKHNMYKFYLDHPLDARKKLQVLCANCNQIKRYTFRDIRTSTGQKAYL